MCPHQTAATLTATEEAKRRFSAFVAAPEFPCVGAKSALNRDRLRHRHYLAFDDASARALCEDLETFSKEFPNPGGQPVSFIATFDTQVADEAAFEALLWSQLQRMHEHDCRQFAWNETVSSDPADDNFSLSIAGRAFFVVGMHPAASRMSRRTPMPCLVFNFHDQFVAMKATGAYDTLQAAIRKRDLALQGSINPELTRFGEASEARQYAGRAVGADWVCPFHQMYTKHV